MQIHNIKHWKEIQKISSLKMFVKGNITNYKLGCHIW
jgi:hypothetical protein